MNYESIGLSCELFESSFCGPILAGRGEHDGRSVVEIGLFFDSLCQLLWLSFVLIFEGGNGDE
jgi:hypothetical protein